MLLIILVILVYFNICSETIVIQLFYKKKMKQTKQEQKYKSVDDYCRIKYSLLERKVA